MLVDIDIIMSIFYEKSTYQMFITKEGQPQSKVPIQASCEF